MADNVRAFGIALDEYTKAVPPGWHPFMQNYPLKLYLEKFDLWKRQTTVSEEEIGVTMVGRLKGPAYRVVMKMRLIKWQEEGEPPVVTLVNNEPVQDSVITGSDAIAHKRQVHPGIDVGLEGHILTDWGYLMALETLQDAYGPEAHDVLGQVLEKFFS